MVYENDVCVSNALNLTTNSSEFNKCTSVISSSLEQSDNLEKKVRISILWRCLFKQSWPIICSNTATADFLELCQVSLKMLSIWSLICICENYSFKKMEQFNNKGYYGGKLLHHNCLTNFHMFFIISSLNSQLSLHIIRVIQNDLSY